MAPKTFTLLLAIAALGAADLEKDATYRLGVNVSVADGASATYDKPVGARSKFTVLDDGNATHYNIVFRNIFKIESVVIQDGKSVSAYSDSQVTENAVYRLPKTITAGNNSLPIENVVKRSLAGPVVGPLIVPYKYRLTDKTIGSSATIGMFAGWAFDVPLINNNYCAFTPIVSLGAATVESPSESGSTTKLGVTWAAGLLVMNFAGVNLGVLYGQDRIGDPDYAYEGKGWVSASVGWTINL